MKVTKTFLVVLVASSLLAGGIAQEKKSSAKATLPVYTFVQLEPFLHPPTGNDTVYLFNFWATFCAPCISELPHFDRAAGAYAGKPVKIILISLDFRSNIESGVVPFIREHGIKSKVVVLNDHDANTWINKVSPKWSGAIPATLVVKGNHREFYEKVFTYDELNVVINNFIKK